MISGILGEDRKVSAYCRSYCQNICRIYRIFNCSIIEYPWIEHSEIVNQLVYLEKSKISDTVKAISCIWKKLFSLHSCEEPFDWFNHIDVVRSKSIWCVCWVSLQTPGSGAYFPCLSRGSWLQNIAPILKTISLPCLFSKFVYRRCINFVWETKN